ncbi:DUF1376 domain-containing protein [Bartonella krasnovii]|uniref:DUF1376 domain-containing protein n=1 Tax=Bartonella krasnovii TaxID=2267275 RepID=A0A5B9D0T6_9HYPH|nr:DUF1376 domain-containing protein [Bartonella krasnovii]QEE12136.1 DUF1376 domain-containing protein [Bartonella krasnovii]UNF37689.1 DUF1376 domain-containing protein [Bartonella krasnovii]UNF42947.1 DUF1376 domain-containing protein [Bartonella krasnovii]UNF54455.1 DUF1376 domain-containing protein [Bartonella krasnovii]UNF56158.1 DUF1376 domain-containing protein [Bartonella krasnovii]
MSSKIPWTRLNTDQWLFKLSDLPPMEVNVYVKLRIRMLHTREPLLNDSRVLSHFTCCTVKRFEKALDYLFRSGHIISLDDGRLWSSDVEEELNNSNENINKFSERAQKAAQAKWAKHHKEKTISDDQNAKHDAKAMLNDAKHDANDMLKHATSNANAMLNDAINNNNNIYNKKTNTIVLAKKEIGSENLETNDLVQEPIEGDTLQSRPEQIEAGVENQPPIHEQENIPKKAKQAKANRGCRIPADFEPDYDFALTEGLPPERIKIEIAKFRDFWKAKAGKDARKTDWQATWRNWVRKAVDDLEKTKNTNNNGGNNGNFSKDQKTRGGTGETIRNLIREAGFSNSTSRHCTTDGAIRHKGVSMDLDQWREIDTSSRGTSFHNLSDSPKLTYLESVC